MKKAFQKLVIERKIAQVKKELQVIDEMMAEASTDPKPQYDETFIIQNHAAEKEKLNNKLAEYHDQLAALASESDTTE